MNGHLIYGGQSLHVAFFNSYTIISWITVAVAWAHWFPWWSRLRYWVKLYSISSNRTLWLSKGHHVLGLIGCSSAVIFFPSSVDAAAITGGWVSPFTLVSSVNAFSPYCLVLFPQFWAFILCVWWWGGEKINKIYLVIFINTYQHKYPLENTAVWSKG